MQNETLQGILRSKIFWAGVVSTVLIVVRAIRPDFALSDSQVTEIVVALVGLVLGSEIKSAGAKAEAASKAKRE